MKIFCLSYAGGTASFYDEMGARLCDENVKIVAIDYAGHGNRRKEKGYKSFEELSEDIIHIIDNSLLGDEEYALLGYSMGALAVADIVKHMTQKEYKNLPKVVFSFAHEPKVRVSMMGICDEEIKRRTINFGGIPEKLVENDAFWRVYLPIYKMDYEIIEQYSFKEYPDGVTIPLHVFYSSSDTLYEDMLEWNMYFKGNNSFHRFEGNHFFLYENLEDIVKIIRDAINPE